MIYKTTQETDISIILRCFINHKIRNWFLAGSQG